MSAATVAEETVDPDHQTEKEEDKAEVALSTPLTPEAVLKKISELEKYCKVAEAELDAAKARHKETQKTFDVCVAKLRHAIHKSTGEPAMPLFEPVLRTCNDGQAADAGEWRAAHLDEFADFPARARERLIEAGIETVGQLADYTKDGKTLDCIAGIGPVTAAKIEEAMEGFWRKRRE